MMKRKEPSASATILNLSGCDLSPSSSTSTSEDNNTYFFHFFQQQCNNNGIQMSNIDTLNISKCRLGPVGVSNLFTFLLSSTAAATPSTEQDHHQQHHELPMPMLKCIYLQRNAIGSACARQISSDISPVRANVSVPRHHRRRCAKHISEHVCPIPCEVVHLLCSDLTVNKRRRWHPRKQPIYTELTANSAPSLQ